MQPRSHKVVGLGSCFQNFLGPTIEPRSTWTSCFLLPPWPHKESSRTATKGDGSDLFF